VTTHHPHWTGQNLTRFPKSLKGGKHMTAKLLEDWFFADDLEALGYRGLANCIRQAGTHEEVDLHRAEIARMVEILDAPGLPEYREIAAWKGGKVPDQGE
jgi:hypothetical protein